MIDGMRVGWLGGRRRMVALIALVVLAALVVGGVVITRQRASGPQEASVTAGGLTYTLTFSPGPYFLREFTVAHLSLTNNGHTPYLIDGACGQPLSLSLTGGSGPTYTLPLADSPYSCPLITRTFAPGQTLSATIYQPLTVSGDATLTAHAQLAVARTDANGSMPFGKSSDPFTGHLPTLRLSVAPSPPTDRVLSLHQQVQDGVPVVAVSGPTTALGNIYTLGDMQCDDPNGGFVQSGPIGWYQLDGTGAGEPSCPGIHEVWAYAFAAPGYAVATGTFPVGAHF